MKESIKRRYEFIKKIRIFHFFYLNYFCKNVVRKDGSKLIPYKNAVIELHRTSQIVLCRGDIELGCDLVRGSKAETRLRLKQGAKWNSDGGCKISYQSTLELLNDAELRSGYFTMNSNSTIVAANKMTLGQDVMISRNVIVYDSDFHSILSENDICANKNKEVVIGDHVWLAANTMVLKNSKIGNGTIISAGSIVRTTISSDSIYNCNSSEPIKKLNGKWIRDIPDNDVVL